MTKGSKSFTPRTSIRHLVGIPAITLDSGASGGRAHALDEWIDVEKTASLTGMRDVLGILLAAAGLL